MRVPREVVAGGRVFPLVVVRHRAARRYLIRVTEEGEVKLTVPRGAPIGAGVRFAETQATWILSEWTRLAGRLAWGDGTMILYRGVPQAIAADAGGIRMAGLSISAGPDHGDIRARVRAQLRTIASTELPARCLALAAEHRFEPSRVTVRDQRSRWGACSARRAITLNWRLIQMSDAVADYVMLHELAHLRHPNHSRRFWREVAAICPTWRSSERWLRQHGRELM